MGTSTSVLDEEQRLTELEEEAVVAAAAVDDAIPVVAEAEFEEAVKLEALKDAEDDLAEAEGVIAETRRKQQSAAEENDGVRGRVAQTADGVEQCRIAVRKLGGSGVGTDEGRAELVMKRFAKGASTLTKQQFEQLVRELKRIQGQPPPSEGDVQTAFERFDADGSGDIDVGELKEALSVLGVQADGPPSLDKMPGPDDADWRAALESISTLQPRELDEVRKLGRPPLAVRRALELVQILFKLVDGADVRLEAEPEWAELQAMVASSGFVKKIIALKPLALSLRDTLFERVIARWPSLLSAAAPVALASQLSAPVDDELETPIRRSPTRGGAPAPGTPAVPSSPSRRAMAAGLQDAPEEAAELTVEAVAYASRPCGAIFRWCATVASFAVKVTEERRAAQRELDRQLRELYGQRGEYAATENYTASLSLAESDLEAELREAQRQYNEAKAEHSQARAVHEGAKEALRAARKEKQRALMKVQHSERAIERRKDDLEKRRLMSAEREKQAALDAIIAARPPNMPPEDALVWITAHRLPNWSHPIEFDARAARPQSSLKAHALTACATHL